MRKRRLLYIVCLLGVFWLNVIYVEYQFFLLLVLLIVVPAISGVLFELAANGLKLYLNIPQKEVHPGQLVTVCIKASTFSAISVCSMPERNSERARDFFFSISAFVI